MQACTVSLLAAKAPPGWEFPWVLTITVPTHRVYPGGRQDVVPNVGQHIITAGECRCHATTCNDQPRSLKIDQLYAWQGAASWIVYMAGCVHSTELQHPQQWAAAEQSHYESLLDVPLGRFYCFHKECANAEQHRPEKHPSSAVSF